MAFQLKSRVEVFVPGGQELLLKPSDMTVALLSRVFKVNGLGTYFLRFLFY